MKRNLRMATLAVTALLTLGSFAVAQDYDHDRDDYRRMGYRSDDIGFNVGYQDGVNVGRQDIYHGKPFNPYPRGTYDDMDRGYRREYGDKGYYKAQYASGYHAGYMAAFHRRY